MEMKKTILFVLAGILLFSLKGVGNTANAKCSTDAERAEWDLTQEYEIQQENVTYYAHLSQDKEKAWIYLVNIDSEADNVTLDFPEKVEGVTVTRIGHSTDLYYESAEDKELLSENRYSISGKVIEPWHGLHDEVRNVTAIKIPDTVSKIDEGTFDGMMQVTEITLPAALDTLENYTFAGSKSLYKMVLGASLRKIESNAFSACSCLQKLKVNSQNKKFSAKNGCLLSADGKTLYWSASAMRKLDVPDSVETIKISYSDMCRPYVLKLGKRVKKIDPTLFTWALIDTIKVNKANKTYAMSGNCLYKKKNGELIYYLYNTKDVVLSKKVKRVTENSRYGYAHKYDNTVTFSKNIRYVDLSSLPGSMDYLTKIIFKGSKVPTCKNIAFLKNYEGLRIKVPAKAVKAYRRVLGKRYIQK
jgi:hypothetical protein